eukprot:TRINITY_DN8414_c0_g1_i1.p1 TRINITY_DN8414_c0_g1~~TRINITY_DN8414_c0_g1_i1.p1  ORF type:complete len:204 (-),score=33.58 TRINITY_DN8414_c0_g1_i1:56-667(-)
MLGTLEKDLEETREVLGEYEIDAAHGDLVSECLDGTQDGADKIMDNCAAKDMLILEHKVHGWTPLLSVAKSGSCEMMEYLIRQGADVNTRNNMGWTPLMWASWRGHVEMADELLSNFALPNITNHEGKTALMLACSNRQVETMKLLVDRGANVAICVKDDVWESALGIAGSLNGSMFLEFLNAVKVHGKGKKNEFGFGRQGFK